MTKVCELKAGEKYKAFHWAEGWVDVLFIGKEYFFGVSDKGIEGSWALSGNWIHIPKPEPRKKPSHRIDEIMIKDDSRTYVSGIIKYLDELFEQGKL